MSDLSTTASSNSPAGSENPATTDDYHRAIQAVLRSTNAKGTDIASAGTIDLGAATGEFVDVTGTTTITSLGTVSAGIVRTVRFTGALTLTHNATSLILPTGANITTAANDVAMFRSLGSGNWLCVGYMKNSGEPLTAATVSSETAVTIANDDYVLIADTSDGDANKKALVSDITPASSSTTVAGIVELSTDAEAQAGTDSTRAVTPDNLGATVIGIGQTWQDVSASRAVNTDYTNNTGRPIQVCAAFSNGATRQFTVDGIDVGYIAGADAAGTVQVIVPNGSVYRLDGTGTILIWSELR